MQRLIVVLFAGYSVVYAVSNLRECIDHARNSIIVHMSSISCNSFHCRNTFFGQALDHRSSMQSPTAETVNKSTIFVL